MRSDKPASRVLLHRVRVSRQRIGMSDFGIRRNQPYLWPRRLCDEAVPRGAHIVDERGTQAFTLEICNINRKRLATRLELH